MKTYRSALLLTYERWDAHIEQIFNQWGNTLAVRDFTGRYTIRTNTMKCNCYFWCETQLPCRHLVTYAVRFNDTVNRISLCKGWWLLSADSLYPINMLQNILDTGFAADANGFRKTFE